jgi:pimeloyl-ACP methyl ester carboxylesterase
MHGIWFPSMRDGLIRAGGDLREVDLSCAFYGDVFRPPERVLSGVVPWYAAEDVCEGFETELLLRWWSDAAGQDPSVVVPDARTLARTPRSVQSALNALSNSRFFAGLAERMMIVSLKQVRQYLTDDAVRAEVQARVERCVSDDTRVLVGHSLGSVVAYEALCAHPEWPVRTLVTLGSPLGVRRLIFDRLRPEPDENGIGRWPGPVVSWTNVADGGDVVALRKNLSELFGDRVRTTLVHCGAQAHDVTRYLTAEAVGKAIASGLADA